MQQSAPLEVGITVSNVDTMCHFYQQVFGCVEARRTEIPADLSASLGIAQQGYLCVWLTTPNDERIKLLAPTITPHQNAVDDFYTARTGLAFLTFYCQDLNPTLALALAEGATLRSAPELAAQQQEMKICFMQDPEGNIVELVETATGKRV